MAFLCRMALVMDASCSTVLRIVCRLYFSDGRVSSLSFWGAGRCIRARKSTIDLVNFGSTGYKALQYIFAGRRCGTADTRVGARRSAYTRKYNRLYWKTPIHESSLYGNRRFPSPS